MQQNNSALKYLLSHSQSTNVEVIKQETEQDKQKLVKFYKYSALFVAFLLSISTFIVLHLLMNLYLHSKNQQQSLVMYIDSLKYFLVPIFVFYFGMMAICLFWKKTYEEKKKLKIHLKILAFSGLLVGGTVWILSGFFYTKFLTKNVDSYTDQCKISASGYTVFRSSKQKQHNNNNYNQSVYARTQFQFMQFEDENEQKQHGFACEYEGYSNAKKLKPSQQNLPQCNLKAFERASKNEKEVNFNDFQISEYCKFGSKALPTSFDGCSYRRVFVEEINCYIYVLVTEKQIPWKVGIFYTMYVIGFMPLITFVPLFFLVIIFMRNEKDFEAKEDWIYRIFLAKKCMVELYRDKKHNFDNQNQSQKCIDLENQQQNVLSQNLQKSETLIFLNYKIHQFTKELIRDKISQYRSIYDINRIRFLDNENQHGIVKQNSSEEIEIQNQTQLIPIKAPVSTNLLTVYPIDSIEEISQNNIQSQRKLKIKNDTLTEINLEGQSNNNKNSFNQQQFRSLQKIPSIIERQYQNNLKTVSANNLLCTQKEFQNSPIKKTNQQSVAQIKQIKNQQQQPQSIQKCKVQIIDSVNKLQFCYSYFGLYAWKIFRKEIVQEVCWDFLCQIPNNIQQQRQEQIKKLNDQVNLIVEE